MKKSNKGSILLLVLVVFAVVIILGTALMAKALYSQNYAHRQTDRQEAYYVAKSVIDAAKDFIIVGKKAALAVSAASEPPSGMSGDPHGTEYGWSSEFPFIDNRNQTWNCRLHIDDAPSGWPATNYIRLTAEVVGGANNITDTLSAIVRVGDASALGNQLAYESALDINVNHEFSTDRDIIGERAVNIQTAEYLETADISTNASIEIVSNEYIGVGNLLATGQGIELQATNSIEAKKIKAQGNVKIGVTSTTADIKTSEVLSKGGSVEIESNGGNVNIPTICGNNDIMIKTNGGDVSINEIRSGGGSIEIDAGTGNITIDTCSALSNIKLVGNEVTVQTSGIASTKTILAATDNASSKINGPGSSYTLPALPTRSPMPAAPTIPSPVTEIYAQGDVAIYQDAASGPLKAQYYDYTTGTFLTDVPILKDTNYHIKFFGYGDVYLGAKRLGTNTDADIDHTLLGSTWDWVPINAKDPATGENRRYNIYTDQTTTMTIYITDNQYITYGGSLRASTASTSNFKVEGDSKNLIIGAPGYAFIQYED